MSHQIRIDLNNDSEAQVVEGALTEAGIPHFIRSFHDSAYDGLFQTELGWGYVETSPDHEEEVRGLIESLRSGGGGQ